MGSTLVGVLLRDRNSTLGACWRQPPVHSCETERLTQVTEDQTLARFLLEEGEITAEQLPTHYSRHVNGSMRGVRLCRAGNRLLEMLAGDLLVLSTDGLHGEIPDEYP